MHLRSSCPPLLGTLVALFLAGVAPALAQTSVVGPFTSTITYRRTDLTSGVFNGADTTPYFSLPTFNQSLGTLLSVNLTYSIQLRTQITATNAASSGSQAVTVKSITSSQTSLFYNTTNTSSGDQMNLGGAFVNPTSLNAIGTTNESASATTAQFTFADLQPQETRTSSVLSASGGNVFTYDATSFSGSGMKNDTVVNTFKGNGSTPVYFGVKTNTDAYQTSGGGNVTLSQATDDQFSLSVSYTYQPVPAPPAAVSMSIGGVVGLVTTGVSRLRTRKRRKND